MDPFIFWKNRSPHSGGDDASDSVLHFWGEDEFHLEGLAACGSGALDV